MDKPILLAMVSVYNSSKWLKARIDNLANTDTYRRGGLFIYCVNAQSPDPQDHVICNELSHMSNFKYEVIPYCTVYGAWNWMINRTDTPFITNANTDDLVAPCAYEMLMAGCNEQNALLAYCGWHTIGDEVTRWDQVTGIGNPLSQYNPAVDQMSCGHFPLWRRGIHEQIGLFDPWFAALGDADLWYRCWINGLRSFCPIFQPVGAYRWRDGQNLWHRTAEDKRAAEWGRMAGRQPGKLEFTDAC